ncbi:MAG: DUF167 domain-containing protein [Eggerthellaceae bacterium]|nr:DUF167 domain-containing protein [Eggerthellaceae bacterium]
MNAPAYITVHVTPKSGRDEVVGFEEGPQGEVLKVRITAPPADGKANKAVCKLIASELRLPKTAVSVASGASSRYKRLAVDADEELVTEWLTRFR